MAQTTVEADVLDVDADGVLRCVWGGGTPEYRAYHDLEWGRPVADDTRLFEKLCLEGFQSGLSWLTILRKREGFREAFVGFDIDRVASFGPDDVERLMTDASIVRHRGKIESTINNARRAADLVEEFGSIAAYVWAREPERTSRPATVTHDWLADHSTSAESTALSKDLKKRGWSFVGPTTVYAFMQAMGLVDDHQHRCFVRQEVDRQRRQFVRPALRAANPGQ
ncbi:MAG: DNA-3-methyladenine glycosylase I [Actinomycetes bacterium]